MVRYSFTRLILPLLCAPASLYAVSNDQLPDMGHGPESPLRKLCDKYDNKTYKGWCFLNNYGWGIIKTSTVPLKRVEVKSRWYEVNKYIPCAKFGFSLFKIDLGKDHLRHPMDKLLTLGTQKDLEGLGGWVTSCALIPDPLLAGGEISENLGEYPYPLAALSKISSQEKGRLNLIRDESVKNAYQDIHPLAKQNSIISYQKKIAHIESQLQNPSYKQEYIQKQQLEILQKRQDLAQNLKQIDQELNTINNIASMYYLNLNLVDPNVHSHLKLIEDLTKQKIDKFRESNNLLQLQNNSENMWSDHVQKQSQEKDERNKSINNLQSLPNSFNALNSRHKKIAITCLNNLFKCTDTGVADKRDNGGLIMVKSKESIFDANQNRYIYIHNLVGLTDIREGDDYIQGNRSTAIDLTTPEVRQWILETITREDGDAPIVSQEAGPSNSNQKRPTETNSIEEPSTKKIKTEPTGDDRPQSSSTNNNAPPIKQEVKEEIKKETKNL